MTGLVTWLWQGTALALVAMLLLRASRALDAATRHALWWGVLAAVLALPLLPSFASVVSVDHPAGARGARAAVTAPLVLPAPPDWLVAVALGAWLGFVLLGVLRIARGVTFVRRITNDAQPLEAEREARLALWRSSPCRRRVALVVSPLVRTACAVGLGRPAIVLPPSLLDAVDDETLDQIVMHERAHLERYDDVWRVAETLVDAVAGLHPGVRIALAHIDLEREAACDDRVVLRTGAADRYAASLAEAASCAAAARGRHEPHLMPSAVSRRSTLIRRVARLLDGTRRRRARLTPTATVVGLVWLGGVAHAAAQLDPVVAFEARVLEALRPDVPVTTASRARATDAVTSAAPQPRAGTQPTSRVRDGEGSAEGQAASELSLASTSDIPASEAHDAPPAPLASRPLDMTAATPPTAVPAWRAQVTRVQAIQSPWAAAADGGAAIGGAARRGSSAVGAGARKAGTSIAGFFARTGRALGRSF